MRLVSCVALELGALLLVGISATSGLLWGMGQLRFGEAQAAELLTPRSMLERERLLRSPDRAVGFEPKLQWEGPLARGTFIGVDDRELLEPLRTGKITRVKFNRGGSSISLRLDFDNGSRAAFKPRQVNYQTVPRKEVAAYRISRLLDLSSVQPAIGRAFQAKELFTRIDAGSRGYLSRLRTEILQKNGKVVGELSWWIPVIKTARVGGFDIDSVEGIVTWKRYLRPGAAIPSKERAMVAQLSNLLLFDFLINNPDRWSGGNAKASPDGRMLYFMDNTLSFGPHPRAARKVRLYLQRTSTFSKSLVAKLRELDESLVRLALAEELGPFDFLLTDKEIKAMFSRRDIALAYVDELIAEHGEEKVLVFP